NAALSRDTGTGQNSDPLSVLEPLSRLGQGGVKVVVIDRGMHESLHKVGHAWRSPERLQTQKEPGDEQEWRAKPFGKVIMAGPTGESKGSKAVWPRGQEGHGAALPARILLAPRLGAH